MSSIPIRQVHFELSSRCNAACQLCPRHTVTENEYHKSQRLKESDLSLHIIKDLIRHPRLKNCKTWLLCGNLGEPMMHPDVVEIVNALFGENPLSWVTMHTNGGIGNTDMWRALGETLRAPRSKVIFSIDGLADTNHIYRRNVLWDTVMRNASAFISAGGTAIWKYIDFAYNHEQISDARSLAKTMRFSQFAVDKNSSAPLEPRADLEYTVKVAPASSTMPVEFDILAFNESLRQETTLNCEHLRDGSIYIDAQARVWPCCHLVTVLSHGYKRRSIAEHFLLDPYGSEWNDLNKHDLEDIIGNRYWSDLYESLPDNSGIYKCSHSCGHNPARTRDRTPETL